MAENMDEYDKKFAEMQKYIPFLEAMIERLQKVKDTSREMQLQKMQSLHGILSDNKRKLKIETLQRCEDVLGKLHKKVQKGNITGLTFPNKKNEDNESKVNKSDHASHSQPQPSDSSETGKKSPTKEADDEKPCTSNSLMDETPASPSPVGSPEPESRSNPIVIPTERSEDYHDSGKVDSKPASPEQCDRMPTKEPIIIPTERKEQIVDSSASNANPMFSNEKLNSDNMFTEWDMLEESENKHKTWKQTNVGVASTDDVTTAAKLVGNSLPQKDSSRPPVSSSHIPTIPVPSLGGSRRLSSVLEKSRISGVSLDLNLPARSESPTNVPEVRLKSPDPDILYPKGKATSPRIVKDAPKSSTSTIPVPLLVSPPVALTQPPLSMEDLADLLNEENDDKSGKETKQKEEEPKKGSVWSRLGGHAKKESISSSSSSSKSSSKEPKSSKSYTVIHEEMDLERERQWEETDKHIVKYPNRKNLVTIIPQTIIVKPPNPNETLQPTDNRMCPLSPVRDLTDEPRITDSYERHPRKDNPLSPVNDPVEEPRYADSYERHLRKDAVPDICKNKAPIPPFFPTDAPVGHEDRMLFGRRQSDNVGVGHPIPDNEPRRDNCDSFYNRPPVPVPPPTTASVGSWNSSPASTNEFCSPQQQWGGPPPPNSFNNPNPPHPMVQPPMVPPPMVPPPIPNSMPIPVIPMSVGPAYANQRQDMWNMSPMEPHHINEPHMPQPPYRNANFPPAIGPMNRPVMEDMREDMPGIPPLLGSPQYPHGHQYMGFPQDAHRNYEQTFDRNTEFTHGRQFWDPVFEPVHQSPNPEAPNLYNRSSTPGPWGRGEPDRNQRNANNNRFYNGDPGRPRPVPPPLRPTFNREVRRSEWDQSENLNKNSTAVPTVSERDPRIRTENNTPAKDASPTTRDPRLANKEKRSGTPAPVVAKPKEPVTVEKDVRKRPEVKEPPAKPTPSVTPFPTTTKNKSKQGSSSPTKSQPSRRNSDGEKNAKDKSQSPLESLYGVIDTRGKLGPGKSLQKFKIPKIKRPQPPPLPEENWDLELTDSTPTSAEIHEKKESSVPKDKVEVKIEEKETKETREIKETEDIKNSKTSLLRNEVLTLLESTIDGDNHADDVQSNASTTDLQIDLDMDLSGQIAEKSKDSSEAEKSGKEEHPKKSSSPKLKDEVTQEFIESLIRKSFEFGEGKKLFEQAKFLQKLGEALKDKKMKKIKKIIDSESESESSGSSEKEKDITRKSKRRKKKRVILSDSSDGSDFSDGKASGDEESKKSAKQDSVVKPEKEKDIIEKEASEGTPPPEEIEEKKCPPVRKKRGRKKKEAVPSKDGVQEEDPKASGSMETEGEDKKEGGKPPAKIKAKRRNSLEMLQEDIREMFISEGVVTATGHRMCRLLKEGQPGLNESIASLPEETTEKDDTMNLEEEEKAEKEKPKRKRAVRTRRKQSKEYVDTSSEEDQPLASRASAAKAKLKESSEEKSNQTLIGKESLRQPRVIIEKTDVSKVDSSKIMFDTSSDESFGIDVSELTAAVDISLHPEQSETQAERKPTRRTRARTRNARKAQATETKYDDPATDDASISDISRSSSVASKKTVDGKLETNEELLSNILVGLSSVDTSREKETAEEAPAKEKDGKKAVLKKKKKRPTWQMGILSKRKRKKAAATNATSNSATSPDPGNDTSVELSKDDETAKHEDEAKEDEEEEEEEDQKPEETSPESETVKNKRRKLFAVPSLKDGKQVEAKDLIDYSFSYQERMRCLHCNFYGKSIVNHYRVNHPDKEISISRLPVEEGKAALEDAKDNDYESQDPDAKKLPFSCRFCGFLIKGGTRRGLEAFYEHCTLHTGEYRHTCNICSYTTPAYSTIKVHYIRYCRRTESRELADAIRGDQIPQENRLYGYLCSCCNFVQLKRSNVEKHVKLWHEDAAEDEVKIIKIDMSNYRNLKDSAEQDSSDRAESPVPESPTVEKFEKDEPIDPPDNADAEDGAVGHGLKIVRVESYANVEVSDDESTKKSQDTDSAVSGGKMSAFVCPPELENKEVEIELERKRKMQEIAENIGIKLHKDPSAKGLSIIDKLKDKIETTLSLPPMEYVDIEEMPKIEQSSNSPEPGEQPMESHPEEDVPEDVGNKEGASAMDTSETPGSDEETEAKIKDPLQGVDQNTSDAETSENDNSLQEEPPLRYESDSSSERSDAEVPEDDVHTILQETSGINGASKAPMLTTIQRLVAQLKQGPKPIGASNDAKVDEVAESGSEKQPEAEEKVDSVETSKDKAESSESLAPSRSSTPAEVVKSAEHVIPKPPDLVPISSTRKMVEKEIAVAGPEKSATPGTESSEDSNPPKNFIRLRRLSGDKLSSGGMQEPDANASVAVSASEETNLTNKSPKSSLSDAVEDVVSTKSQEPVPSTSTAEGSATVGADMVQTNSDEECSFLKISSVISLAPNAENNATDSPIISDIRKAVETTPVIPKSISLLKKSNPIILKRLSGFTLSPSTSSSETLQIIPVKGITTTSAGSNNFIVTNPKGTTTFVDQSNMGFPVTINKTTNAVSPIAPRPITVRSGTSLPPNMNYKIVKVVRSSNIIKQKDFVGFTWAAKIKTPEIYASMLQPTKLAQTYKCMARNCAFTTSNIDSFSQHYEKHVAEVESKSWKPPFDFKRCAYCHAVPNNWEEMKKHLQELHEYCLYQCSYCFYRAASASYVELHQATFHLEKPVAVLLGNATGNFPSYKNINRREFVKPFVCHHECGKFFYVPEAFISHLKTKHKSVLSIFKCHLCPVTYLKPERLVAHYKIHSICKYQCLFCVFGSDNTHVLHNHLSIHHYNRLPVVLLRMLPLKATRDKDVVDQLVLQKLDRNVKSNELILPSTGTATATAIVETSNNESIDTDNSGQTANLELQSPKPVEDSSQFLQNETTKTLLTSPILSKDGESTLSSSKQSSPVSSGASPESTKSTPAPEKIVKQNAPESSDSVKDSTLEELEMVQEHLDGGEKDPLDLSNDEYVSINLLDNPEFVKTANLKTPPGEKKMDGAKSAGTSSPKRSLGGNNSDDSDIEILETIEKKKKTKLSEANNEKEEEEPQDDLLNDSSNQQEDSNLSMIYSTENSNTSTDANFPKSEGGMKNPLTLDDIKDTGFTGSDLYKCGNKSCDFRAPLQGILRAHIKECSNAGDALSHCAHCKKRFVKIGFLMEHLKTHGLKRFGCALCSIRYSIAYQANSHMKNTHKFPHYKMVPADPKNPSPDGLFVVHPVQGSPEKLKNKKTKLSKNQSDEKLFEKGDCEKTTFGPEDIEQLPRQAIYNRGVQCAVCPYTTKVRTNIIRHLQLHAKDETVPESGPVNPVPCLDKKEKMFDKMVNLALSSHQNGRMGGKPAKETPAESEEELLPKFVPENKRYACGAPECTYISVDEAMLRYHLKALHSEEIYFRCPHCPKPVPGQEQQNVPIEKMGVHLKMHDTKLYKCSHCNHHHHHRHVVERHLSDKHPEKRPFVKVIRELDTTETTQALPPEETEEQISDREGNHWKCNICEHRCAYKADMVTHVSNEHNERCQFKCTLCSYKTNGKLTFDQHAASKHLIDNNVEYSMVYEKIKGSLKKDADGAYEQGGQDEPFDTTPLWRRDMPRVRHIRGILLEEEDNASANETPLRTYGKRKSDTELNTGSAKIRSSKFLSLDENKKPETVTKPPVVEKPAVVETIPEKEPTVKAEVTEEVQVATDDIGVFGPYGKPQGNSYVCTLCTQYTSKYKQDIRDHLYRELKYVKFHCRTCGFLAVNRNALTKHFNRSSCGTLCDFETLPVDAEIEEWVRTLLERQHSIMRSLGQRGDGSTMTQSELEAPMIYSSVGKRGQKPTDSANTSAVTKQEEDGASDDPLHDTSAECDDSGDNDLVIDIKDDEMNEKDAEAETVQDEEISSEKDEGDTKPLVCKHCGKKLAGWRGFKLHVQLTHLQRLGFLCPYCDSSTNSEQRMHQHIRSKHPDKPEKIIPNPAAGGPELSDDFWRTEYGLIIPQRKKRIRKRKIFETATSSDTATTPIKEESEPLEKRSKDNCCSICDFDTASGQETLESHLKTHIPNKLNKCGYCRFTSTDRIDVYQHWIKEHPKMAFKVNSEGSVSETKAPQQNAKPPDPGNSGKKLFYNCFYCSLRSRTIDTVRKHWIVAHKNPNPTGSKKLKTGVPFRYKEILVAPPPPQKMFKCAYCPKTGSESMLRSHIYQKHKNLHVQFIDIPEQATKGDKKSSTTGWMCGWCYDLCENELEMNEHHRQFHSHLALKFLVQSSTSDKTLACPECQFTTTVIGTMRSHISKHIDPLKCKYCEHTFGSASLAAIHSEQMHPELEPEIENVANHPELVEKLMNKVLGMTRNQSVAKKSTSKPRQQQIRVKNVARKSTNPLPKYPPGTKFGLFEVEDMQASSSKKRSPANEGVSYYKVPKEPINLSNINTCIVVAGQKMKLSCIAFSQLLNINPRVVLKDLKQDVKNFTPGSKR